MLERDLQHNKSTKLYFSSFKNLPHNGLKEDVVTKNKGYTCNQVYSRFSYFSDRVSEKNEFIVVTIIVTLMILKLHWCQHRSYLSPTLATGWNGRYDE